MRRHELIGTAWMYLLPVLAGVGLASGQHHQWPVTAAAAALLPLPIWRLVVAHRRVFSYRVFLWSELVMFFGLAALSISGLIIIAASNSQWRLLPVQLSGIILAGFFARRIWRQLHPHTV